MPCVQRKSVTIIRGNLRCGKRSKSKNITQVTQSRGLQLIELSMANDVTAGVGFKSALVGAFDDIGDELKDVMSDEQFEKAALLRIFHELDADNSNTLTTREVFKALSFGAAAIFHLIAPFPTLCSLFTTENIASAMKYADIDNNGEVDQEEFLQLLGRLKKEEEERLALLDVYTALDANGDSRVLAHEIKWALKHEKQRLMPLLKRFPELVKTLENPDKFMKAVQAADDNADGVVSSDEFCALVKNIKARDRQEIVVKKLFTLLDVDGTGSLAYRSVLREMVLNAKEICPIVRDFPGLSECFTPFQLRDSILRADTNDDNLVQFDEFINYVNAVIEEAKEYSTLSKIFALLDRDNSGTVDRHEVTKALLHNEKGALREFLGLFPELSNVLRGKRFASALESADTDDDGVVDEQEFIKLAARLKLEEEERNALLTIFSILDANDDKTLTARELKYELKRNRIVIKPLLLKHPGLYKALEPNRFIAALKRMDTNRDGKVDVKEFIHFATYLRQSSGGFKQNRFKIKASENVSDENETMKFLDLEEKQLMASLIRKYSSALGGDGSMQSMNLTDISKENEEQSRMEMEENLQRQNGDLFYGIDQAEAKKRAMDDYQRSVLKKENELKRQLTIEVELYEGWKRKGLERKRALVKEKETAMEMRRSKYISNFFRAKNSIELFSVIKQSGFVRFRSATLDPFGEGINQKSRPIQRNCATGIPWGCSRPQNDLPPLPRCVVADTERIIIEEASSNQHHSQKVTSLVSMAPILPQRSIKKTDKALRMHLLVSVPSSRSLDFYSNKASAVGIRKTFRRRNNHSSIQLRALERQVRGGGKRSSRKNMKKKLEPRGKRQSWKEQHC